MSTICEQPASRPRCGAAYFMAVSDTVAMGTGWCRHGDRHAPGCSREACVRMADCQEARVAVHASPVTSIHHLLSWRRAWSGGRGAGGGGGQANEFRESPTDLSVCTSAHN